MSIRSFHYKGLEFRAAVTRDEHSQLERVCCEAYVSEFGGQPIGSRAFDANATLFGAWNDGTPVGTLRFVPDGPLGLPLEATRGANCDAWRARGRLCELGRFAVDRSADNAPFILMGLLRLSFWHAVRAQVSFLMACAPRRIWTLYQRMRMQPFGHPFQHPAGELFVHGVLDVGEELARACRELEQGINDSVLHEILERRSSDEDRLLRSYLTQRGADPT